jgi:hypothetical protein
VLIVHRVQRRFAVQDADHVAGHALGHVPQTIGRLRGRVWREHDVRPADQGMAAVRRLHDFARRDATNRLLGQLGEKFAVEIEKRRLLFYGRDDLAVIVEWVAMRCGDGVGFDVLSFDENDEAEQFIEVKTTGLGKHFPFYVTANEVRCSEDCFERDGASRPRAGLRA